MIVMKQDIYVMYQCGERVHGYGSSYRKQKLPLAIRIAAELMEVPEVSLSAQLLLTGNVEVTTKGGDNEIQRWRNNRTGLGL